MIRASFDRRQIKRLREALKRLELTPKKQQRLLWRLAKYGVIPASKKAVRQQATPEGTPWAARKSGRRGKMLTGLVKLIAIKELPASGSLRLYLRGGNYSNAGRAVRSGVVGYAQQYGMTATVKKSSLRNLSESGSEKASLRQVRRLRKLGYKVKGRRGMRNAKMSEIRELSAAQAGLIIRKLSGEEPKDSWIIELPSRVFLGISDTDFDKALARQLQAIGYGTEG
ncbi:hypothetical protein RY966_004491 [Enterobacter kobei]|nr:hypothetical protein [Enterobacter kobei]